VLLELKLCDDINCSYKHYLARTETDLCQVARKSSKILISLLLINGNLDISVLECALFSDSIKYVFYC